MYKTNEKFFIIPKREWYGFEVNNMQDFFKRFDDFEIKECKETEIKKMIDEYNHKQDIKFFDRLKEQHFYFVKATKIEIGKYKSGKIEILDIWKE